MQKKNKYHYVYKITCPEIDCFYIGLRSSEYPFEHDHTYWGSGQFIEYAEINNLYLVKEMVKSFSTREEAAYHELKTIDELKNHPNCMNIHSSGYVMMYSKKTGKDKLDKMRDFMNNFIKSGQYLEYVQRTKKHKFSH